MAKFGMRNEFTIHAVANGFTVQCSCALGNHYIAIENGVLVERVMSFTFPTFGEAVVASNTWQHQQRQQHHESEA